MLAAALRVAGTTAARRAGTEPLRESVRLLEDVPDLDLARSVVALGAALRRDSALVEAREHLRRGLDLAHRAVETHPQHAFRKLGVRRREELPSIAVVRSTCDAGASSSRS